MLQSCCCSHVTHATSQQWGLQPSRENRAGQPLQQPQQDWFCKDNQSKQLDQNTSSQNHHCCIMCLLFIMQQPCLVPTPAIGGDGVQLHNGGANTLLKIPIPYCIKQERDVYCSNRTTGAIAIDGMHVLRAQQLPYWVQTHCPTIGVRVRTEGGTTKAVRCIKHD